jgi:hypothetical protein
MASHGPIFVPILVRLCVLYTLSLVSFVICFFPRLPPICAKHTAKVLPPVRTGTFSVGTGVMSHTLFHHGK